MIKEIGAQPDGMPATETELNYEDGELDNNNTKREAFLDWKVFEKDGLYGYINENQNIVMKMHEDYKK